MPSYEPLKSASRVLEVLVALNRAPVTSVRDLHAGTAIPKPTLVRILETLIEAGFVARDTNRGGYQVTSAVTSLSAGFHGEPMVVEVAAPLARGLTADILWPVAIATLDVDAMVVRYSTIPDSPLAHVHTTLNKRLSLVARAHGRAYLAFCPPDERRILLGMAARSPGAEDQAARSPKAIGEVLREVRANGYAVRDPAIDPRTSTMAVPVMQGDRVVATAGATFFTRALSHADAVRDLAPRLRDLARTSADRLAGAAP